MMSILVKVILVLHVAFPPFVLQILPMLSVLLSAEELELLVIPYCHVFENHIHFLSLWLICPSTSSYRHQAMVPILHHIVITNFHPVLAAASSSTVFLLLTKQNMYWNTLPSWSLRNYLPNELSYAWIGFRTRELCQFYSGDAIFPNWFQTRSAQCVYHNSLYGTSKLMILDALEIIFEGSSEYYFSSIVHLRTRAQILMETSTSFSSLVND
jgi:hypothetical protein